MFNRVKKRRTCPGVRRFFFLDQSSEAIRTKEIGPNIAVGAKLSCCLLAAGTAQQSNSPSRSGLLGGMPRYPPDRFNAPPSYGLADSREIVEWLTLYDRPMSASGSSACRLARASATWNAESFGLLGADCDQFHSVMKSV